MGISLASLGSKALDTATGGLVSGIVGGALDLLGLGGSSGLSAGDQKELMKYQNELNMNAWMQQFSTQAQYNDPAQVVRRYMGAGINPSSAFDKNTVGISSASQLNPVTGFPAPNKTMQQANSAQYISSIAQLMTAVSGSRLNDAQANSINEKLFSELRAMDDAHEWQDLTNNLLAAYGNKKASADLNLVLARVKESGSVTELNSEKALTEQKKQVNIAVDSVIKEVEKDLKGKNLEMAKIDLETYRKRRLAELDNIYSDSQRNRAQASEASAHASELTQSAIGKELQNNISKATNLYDIENAIYNSDVLQMLQQSDNKEKLFQSLCREVKKSSIYKNSENAQKVDAALEHFAQMLGIPIAVIASAAKVAK